MRKRIYRIMKHNEENNGWDEGVTLKEMAEALGKKVHAISGRFSDLHDLGLIKKTSHIRNGCRAWTTKI
jgi:predicted transcriptional regulator